MRTTTCSAFVLSIALLATVPVTICAATPEQAVLRVQIDTRAGTLDGTCVLVYRESGTANTVLYFLTSARLLKSTEADLRAGARRIRILRDDTPPIEVATDSLVVPFGDMVDVAVIRVVAPVGALVPLSPMFTPPESGGAFIITGFGADGSHATVLERVRFEASLLIVGDRDASGILGCEGAPAIVEGRVFGLVSECAAGRPPSITPLSAAQSFLSRNVPDWRLDTSETPAIGVVTRPIRLRPPPLLLPETAEPRFRIVRDAARAHDSTYKDPGGADQFVPPTGWTLYDPVSPDEVLMRPDEGDGLIEITCGSIRAGLDLVSQAAVWESEHVGPNQLLLMKRAGRMVDLDGEVAYAGVYERDDVLAKARFVGMSDRFCVFLGVFLRDDFGRREATLDRLVQSWTEHGWQRSCALNPGGIS